MRIAINGFGRIGRLAARILLTRFPEISLVAVNDLSSADNLAYLLQYDSTYRQAPFTVDFTSDSLLITQASGQTHTVQVLSESDPASLPWNDLQVDVVLECSGRFLTEELAGKHIHAGAGKVVLSAPAKSPNIPTVVLGANLPSWSDNYFGSEEHSLLQAPIVSNASCTTNCVAPALQILQENFGLEQMTALTVHAYTATQLLQDGMSHKEFRDGRAAAANLIPSKTGAAKAVELVLPQLAGKLNLSSLRVPVITGSVVYVTATLTKTADKDSLNQIFAQAAAGRQKGVLEYSQAPLVSSDVIQNPHSCVLDSDLTEVMGKMAKLVLWYDNEWGYANRLVELSAIVSQV